MEDMYMARIMMVEDDRVIEFPIDSKENMEMYVRDFRAEKAHFRFKSFRILENATGETVFWYKEDAEANACDNLA